MDETVSGFLCQYRDEEGLLHEFFWPYCAVLECPNGRCFNLDSPYCHPHTQAIIVADVNAMDWPDELPY